MMSRQKGFSLHEIVVALVVAAIITVAMLPLISGYILHARITAAEADMKSIGDGITNFEKDVGRYPVYTSGTAGSGFLRDSDSDVIRLDGPGTMPLDTTAGQTGTWVSGSTQKDDLVDQLVSNLPGYITTSNLGKPFNWKGPYLSPKADPWGNKYLVNIGNGKSSSSCALFVISAGPDGKIDTNFCISETSTVTPGGDDLLYRIR
jgi:prepilin-type N-terminal cleavage/methylation domain-containing protein